MSVKTYNYVLGVDLGIASIGTAVIRLSKDGQFAGILDAGVRIFETPPGAAGRRQKRQVKNVINHRHTRLHNLRLYLQEQNLLPSNKEELSALIRRSPYALRAHGVRHKFSNIHELGRCFMHIAKFRGASFLTQMEEISSDEDTHNKATQNSKKDKQKSADLYRRLERIIYEEKISLGEFFMRRLRKGGEEGCVRRRGRFIEKKLIDYAVPRFLVKNDFLQLWQCQSEYYPFLTEAIKDEIYKYIFTDRPHAPYALGVCSLDPDSREARLPRMHRIAEERRIYEQINNIRFKTRSEEYTLTKDMRDALVTKVMHGEDLNKTTIKKYIKPFFNECIFSVNMKDAKKIAGFSHIKAFAEIPVWKTLSQAEQDTLLAFIAEPRIEPENPQSCLMSEDDFLEECVERLKLNGTDAIQRFSRCIAMLPKERTSLGFTASTRILAKLKEGCLVKDAKGIDRWRPVSQREAADMCGYKAEEEKKRAIAGTYCQLPYYGEILRHDVSPVHPWHTKSASENESRFGRVPNPVVHVVLNQLRKVINEIIALYGKPQQIHVEFAREFGMSAKKREELIKKQEENTKKNERIDKELRNLGLVTIRKNRIKYRLWLEQGQTDIYTGEPIQATEFHRYEIDHIIPQALGGTDTYANLALTNANSNGVKDNSFAYDFIQNNYPQNWEQIFKKISDKKYPQNKAWRFMSSAEEKFTILGDEDQTDHRLIDTAYIAKMAARYLSALCPNVIPIRGAMTAQMRHLWGLDGLEYELVGSTIRKDVIDAVTGEVCIDPQTGKTLRNPLWKAKPRIDYRHHALDAIVLACATRSLAQKMTLCERKGMRLKNVAPPFGIDNAVFRQYVLKTLRETRVSVKSEHGIAGQLHDEKRYRILCSTPGNESKFVVLHKHKLSNINKKSDVAKKLLLSCTTVPQDMKIIGNIWKHAKYQCQCIESMYDRAQEVLKEREEQRRREEKKIFPIDETHIVQEAILLARKHYKNMGDNYSTVENKCMVGICAEKKYGFEPKNNFCMDFFVINKQKIGWECITRFHANQRNFIPQWKKDGYKLLWSVWKRDILELEITEAFKNEYKIPLPIGRHLFMVQKFSIDKKMQVNILTDARALKVVDNQSRWISGEKGLEFFTKALARKVELSPFGKVRRKHTKLWHDTKTTKNI